MILLTEACVAMKHRFDFAINYGKGTLRFSELLEEEQAPHIGDLRRFRLNGAGRMASITQVLPSPMADGTPRARVFGWILDYGRRLTEVSTSDGIQRGSLPLCSRLRRT